MKKTTLALCVSVGLVLLAGGNLAGQALSLDDVIAQAAKAVEAKIAAGSKLAILNFSSSSEVFSDYVIEELSGVLVMNGKAAIVERRRLDLIRKEMQLQLSGDVSDDSAQAAGKQLGAQAVVSGSLTNIGTAYRFRVKVISVETARIEAQVSYTLYNDEQVAFLLSGNQQTAPPIVAKPPSSAQARSPAEEAERAANNAISRMDDALASRQRPGSAVADLNASAERSAGAASANAQSGGSAASGPRGAAGGANAAGGSGAQTQAGASAPAPANAGTAGASAKSSAGNPNNRPASTVAFTVESDIRLDAALAAIRGNITDKYFTIIIANDITIKGKVLDDSRYTGKNILITSDKGYLRLVTLQEYLDMRSNCTLEIENIILQKRGVRVSAGKLVLKNGADSLCGADVLAANA